VSLVVLAVLNSLVSIYYYLRVVVTLWMKPERQPSTPILEALPGGRSYALQGPGAMAAEAGRSAEAAPPPRLAEHGGRAARVVVLVCLLATLWLGMGPSSGGLPGVSTLLHWAQTAVSSLR
jgi:hypothetical protein